jgi:hypothetical protein
MAKHSGKPPNYCTGLLRTYWIDAERRHIREGWTSPGRIRPLADAAETIQLQKIKNSAFGFLERREHVTIESTDMRAQSLHTDQIFDLDVVLGHKVYHVLFLADATCACTLDRVRSFEHEGASFSCELDRELENLSEFCRVERVISDINELPVG